MIQLSDYQDDNLGMDGFAGEAAGQDLLKAMRAGQVTGRDTTNQLLTQEPLKAESLEKTLKSLEFRMKDVQLWDALPKLPAYNTVEEFLQLESYGVNRGGFYNEGELSDVEDSAYRRRAELVKYIQVTGEVTYQAQLVRSHVEAMRKEIENKTMWIIRKADQSLTHADASVVPQEFNSLYKQHASIGSGEGDLYTTLDEWMSTSNGVVVDLRGGSLTQEKVEDAAVQIDANFGNIDTLFAPPSVISGLAKDYFQRQRILMGASGYRGTIGTNPKAIDTSFGEVALKQDKFMKKFPVKILSASAGSNKAPNKPTSAVTALSGADGGSRFASGEAHTGALGAVYYAVSALNRYGESALTINNNTTKVTLTAGQSMDMTVVDGGGAIPATGYQVYRSKITTSVDATADAVEFYPIFKVSAAELAAGYDAGSAGDVRDRNRFLPDTEDAFTTEMASDILSFKQLAPISKLDLAVLGMSKRFITFLFGTPILYTPKKMVRFLNAGPYVAA
jgi:hypothetical protein